MEQIIKNPLSVEIEKINKSFMISFSFEDDEPLLMEASFVAGNIFINGSLKVGFDAPETFETYFGCVIEQVIVTTHDDRLYLDIYVESD